MANELSVDHEKKYFFDINKVFIPFRPVLEMELLVSAFLAVKNYEVIQSFNIIDSSPAHFASILELDPNSIYYPILERFFSLLDKIIPVAMYARDMQSQIRLGNVNAYTESRIPLFYALDRLKVKLIILRNFFQHLKNSHYQLSSFTEYPKKTDKSFISILFAEYYKKTQEYFSNVSWKPEHDRNLESVSYRHLQELNNLIIDHAGEMNYIVRGLKASLFTSKVLFQVLDIADAFGGIPLETLLLNRDFIPGMLNIIGECFRIGNAVKLHEATDLFLFFMDKLVDGVNQAIKLASHDTVLLEKDDLMYYSGHCTEF